MQILEEFFPAQLLFDAETNQSKVLVDGNFELLGFPIVSSEHCAAYTAGLVRKADELLRELSQLDDPQVATRLLRSCAASNKLTHASRCTPAEANGQQLQGYDSKVRLCFSKATSLLPDD